MSGSQAEERERQTRRRRIDPRLQARGWAVVPADRPRTLVPEAIGEYKPEDYLKALSRFVRENPAHVEAIGILLNRPQEWSTDVLSELRQKLAATKERFTVENLQKAHAARYRKALVDIISMVKHAADGQQPLMTAEERVDRAIGQVIAGRSFTDEQQAWLHRIRSHLIENLSVSATDFDDLPLFARQGGSIVARKAFKGQLDRFLNDLYKAMAA